MTLENIIRKKIELQGPISFCDFMEMALYYPGLGYYTSEKKKIGNEGDFYTSCTISPLFGHMLARQLLEMRDVMKDDGFVVVEYGAGTGHLCKSILEYVRQSTGGDTLRYVIIEKSEALRQVQKDFLREEKVEWVNSLAELGPFKGCVVANEVLDNFSVHRVTMRDQLYEVFVGYDQGFIEILRPASTGVSAFFSDLRVRLPEGFAAEACLGMKEWICDIAAHLQNGYIMTIDYGYTAAELLQEHRREGTLVCYHKHHVSDNFYADIGAKDITSHVNFSALGLWASQCGLEFSGFRNQGSFLEALGFFSHMKAMRTAGQDPVSLTKKENLIAHTLIEDMGKKFKVLVLQKHVAKLALTGFQQLATVRDAG